MQPYTPERLPISLSSLNWHQVTLKVSEASAALAYYNGVLEAIINPSIFLSPLETKEAVLSSRIEGTITTVDEVLKYEVDLKPDSLAKENDILEVLNYRKATRTAKDWLWRDLPFNLTLICEIQKELLQEARGKEKHLGEIRKEQVWIGPEGCRLDEATYVPPEPLAIKSLLDNLLDYMSLSDQEILIQTAIMHAQFEMIHPFYDGNGRTGRILIPLFLWQKGRISSPMFYISEYFDEHRDQYVENLRKISEDNNWEQWILYFLEALSLQAKRNSEKANQVLSLYNRMRDKMADLTKSPHAMRALDTLFMTPIFRPGDFIKLSGFEVKTAHRLIARLKSAKVLTTLQKHAGRTPEVLVFDDLFQLIR